MTALPPMAAAAIAAMLVASLARAYFGAPPARSDAMAAGTWGLAGLMMMAAALLAGAAPWHRELLTAGAVEAVCVAGWWLRSADGEQGRQRVEPPPAGHEPPPDWDEFDRLRAAWSRGPRELA